MSTIINPLTGRVIKVGKVTYRKVMKLKSNINDLLQVTKKQDSQKREIKKKELERLAKVDIADLLYSSKKHDKQKREEKKKVQDRLAKIDITDLLYTARKHVSGVNAKKSDIQKFMKKNDEFETKILMVPRINNYAFKHALVSYVIKPIESNKYNYEQFIIDMKYNANKALLKEIRLKRGIRAQFTILANFYQSAGDADFRLEEKNFNSSCNVIVNTTDIKEQIEIFSNDLMLQIEEFSSNKSGWTFHSIKFLEINIYKYKPLKGSSYIELPKFIQNKKACLNVKNKDEKCFLYSVILHDHPTISNIDRGESVFKKYTDKYDNTGINYPMTLNQISKFEKQNNKTINVYSYEISFNKETKKQSLSVFPIHLSKNLITNYKDCCNLLMIKNGEKSHYVLIKNMSALFREHNSSHKSYICPSCLKSYREEKGLDQHMTNGCTKFGEKVELPSAEKSKEYIQFKSIHKMLKKPFVIYADFESLLLNVERDENALTQKYQKHEACGYAYKRVSTVDTYDKPLQLYRGDSTESVAEHFINAIVKESDEIRDIMSEIIPMDLTEDEEKEFTESCKCYLCGINYNNDDIKVRDHDHLTGAYRGSAHQKCNLQYSFKNYRVPVIFHNLKGYDSHLIIKAFNNKNFSIDCIPTSTEKYLSFTISGKITFIDSLSFIASSLENLVKALPTDKFKHFDNHFKTNIEQKLLKQKGIYPYDYMNSYDKFEETSFPSQKDCYSQLNKESISDTDYKHALNVWKQLNINNMGEYHDLYLATDVLLLTDVFEAFRDTAISNYHLDPTHYVSLPGFGWDALLKMTKIKLDVISDYDMYLMIESGIRGGMSMISHRHSMANNKYMKDYDASKDSKYIMYLDANNLYGWSMIQYLPTNNYKWEKPDKFDQTVIMMLGDCDDKGYIFEVDLEYPESLHDLHNDYPLAPESFKVDTNILSDHAKQILEMINSKHDNKCKKLTPTLLNKQKYVVHYRNLKFYLEQGMILKKIHRVVSFDQAPWMKPYIDFNTNERAKAKYDYEKDFFKLMNNATFGKTMENVRKRIRFELVNDETRFKKLVNDPTFDNAIIMNDNLCGVMRKKASVKLDKPIAIGMCVLDLSKLLMYDYHYNTIKKQYKDKATLLFTDTDSLTYEIKTNDIYDDMRKDKHLYDFSDYPKDHPLYDVCNKKVIGKFKDETSSKSITEFVGLRAKMYSFKTADEHESKKAKGIKKLVVKKELRFSDYKRSLFGSTMTDVQQTTKFNSIRSYKHDIYTIEQCKIGLCSFDDKRYLIDNVNTYAYGHKNIKLIN